MAVLAAKGLWRWVGMGAAQAALLGAFVWLTFRLTRGRPPLPEADDERSRARLVAQLVVVLGLAGLTVVRFADLPVWSTVFRALYRAGEALPGHNPNWLVNPVLYVVLPGAAVLALGARWRGLGFRAGWRPWRVMAVWCAPVVAGWVWALATGAASVGRIAGAVASNAVLNGASEEFLWRGVVQTRIGRLWTPAWGLVLASLAFGWWHIDSIHDWAGDDLLVAAALNVTVQATMGLAFGVIFDRTRNLLAPSVIHAVVNSIEV
jgi:hypothetical protein